MPTEIQVYASYLNKIIDHYDVKTWEGPDLKEIITPYTVKDAIAKFGSLLDPTAVGTPSIPDRFFLIFNDDGTLMKVDAQVTSESLDSFHQSITSADQLSAKVVSDATAIKVDVAQKVSVDPIIDVTPDPIK